MATDEKFERVLANLYKAALGEVEWGSIAGSINDVIHANGHSVTHAGVGPGGEPVIHFSRFFVGTEDRNDLKQLYCAPWKGAFSLWVRTPPSNCRSGW